MVLWETRWIDTVYIFINGWRDEPTRITIKYKINLKLANNFKNTKTNVARVRYCIYIYCYIFPRANFMCLRSSSQCPNFRRQHTARSCWGHCWVPLLWKTVSLPRVPNRHRSFSAPWSCWAILCGARPLLTFENPCADLGSVNCSCGSCRRLKK